MIKIFYLVRSFFIGKIMCLRDLFGMYWIVYERVVLSFFYSFFMLQLIFIHTSQSFYVSNIVLTQC
jgi:hypothetical protein